MVVERVGVSFEPELLSEFDRLISGMGYTNRSEAIRDIVREYLNREAIEHRKGEVFGTLTICYNHHAGKIKDRLMECQHENHELILFTSHIHIDHDTCLEVVVIKGDAEDVKKLADTIRAIKGVYLSNLVITAHPVIGHHHGIGDED
ncbi:MAG: nickel-responsive transcriptional regulator NikR [Thermoplasmata archaeon]